MSDETEEQEEVAEGEEGASEEQPKKKGFGLKTLAIFGVPLILVLGGAGYFVASHFGWMGGGEESVKTEAQAPSVYYDLPEMVVNLSSTDSRSQYLKIKVALEAKDNEALGALEPVMPRILDMFQVYLRELRSSDLDGSAGLFRLKEELLRRINLTIHPNRIDRVLFKEIIVQ